jgi:hypothetical protein
MTGTLALRHRRVKDRLKLRGSIGSPCPVVKTNSSCGLRLGWARMA